jgi:hypothetical protein
MLLISRHVWYLLDHFQHFMAIAGRILLKWIFERCDRTVCIGLIWLIVGSSGGL